MTNLQPASDSNSASNKLLATPTLQCSLDRKQQSHQQNQWSASDFHSDRMYRSKLR